LARSAQRSRPIPFWALHLLAVVAVVAGLLAPGSGLVQAAPATGGQSFYRYVGPAELEAIQQTGLLRGGRPGDTFWTDAEYTSAAEAQDKLALPVTPELRVRFVIVNSPTLTRNGSLVDPMFGGAGGGHEWASPDPVQVEIIDVQPLT
jgi:hypothetical protein